MAALKAGNPEGNSGASIVLTDVQALHDLNLRFRGLNEPTDVLSFARVGGSEREGTIDAASFPDIPGDHSLGDVVVSFPHAQTQAKERGVSTEQELALLIIHGVLHLLGHDHAEATERALMQSLENEALNKLFAGALT